MASFSLDDIRAAAEKKYGSTDIDLSDGYTVRLLNPLRLPKEKRDALAKIGDRLESEDVDQADVFADALRLAAATPAAAERLIEELGGDLALLAQVFEAYTKGVELGGSLGLGELIDQYGEGLYPDLLFYYGVDLIDTITGLGAAPSLVLALSKRLPDTSMTVALASGGREHFGWGLDRHMQADIYDALSTNTRATGNWGGKPPKIQPYPRPDPKAETPEEKKPATVASVFKRFKQFMPKATPQAGD